MADQNKSLNDRLREIKEYSLLLKKAARWETSNESIAHVESGHDEKKKREYVYEFYCYLRILKDLKENYSITFIQGGKYASHFPKAPGSKENFPYFSIQDKSTGEEVFQLCAGIDIIGQDGETSAPDISFLKKDTGFKPDFNSIEMLFDAKFKHDDEAKLSKGEFNDVFAMVFNLNCNNFDEKFILFHEFIDKLDLNGNCILTNGNAYNENESHHKRHSLKVVEKFDLEKTPRIIG